MVGLLCHNDLSWRSSFGLRSGGQVNQKTIKSLYLRDKIIKYDMSNYFFWLEFEAFLTEKKIHFKICAIFIFKSPQLEKQFLIHCTIR